MKKKLLIISITLIIGITLVFALTNKFSIDTSKFSFSKSSKNQNVLDNFDDSYKLSASLSESDDKFTEEITTLSRKVTYLLLGEPNSKDESSEEYYKRHQDYLGLRYNPEVPKDDSTFTGLDENSQEYKDDLVSGIAVPGMFNILNELDISYSSFGNIRVSKSDNMVLSVVTLPNVRMKEENRDEPMKYNIIETNLLLYYSFKELDGEYKLYYLIGEYTDDLNDYFEELDSNENKGMMHLSPTYDSNLKDIYNYSKLEEMSEGDITNIYEKNKNNIVILNSYYNNYVVANANGFFINEGLIVTSWSFLEKSLIDAQYMVITDSNGNALEQDGIVTVNPETDIAVIKLKNKTNNKVILGDGDSLKIEDPVITISSKTGVGLTVQTGIVISLDQYIQSAIPLNVSDEGSPLINKDGLVVGLNTSKQTNSSTSLAIPSNILNEIQNKFNNLKFEDIKTIKFNELKEKYYYVKYNDDIIYQNIPKNKWNTYKKIGNVEETINLELIKANYKDGIVSLRYKNNVSSYISTMQLSNTFRNNLINDGYKETLTSSTKYIYENDKYQVIVMEEFDYLIIVMVKL